MRHRSEPPPWTSGSIRLVLAMTLGLLPAARALQAQSLPTEFLRSAVLVTFEQPKPTAGSGFLVVAPTAPDRGYVLLVTNRHVLPPAGSNRSIKIRVVTGEGSAAEIRSIDVPIWNADGALVPEVRLHTRYDLAIVNISALVESQRINATWIPIDLLATPEALASERIGIGDEVFLLGYPTAIFDSRNTSPVLRVGVLASDPTVGFGFNADLQKRLGLPEFLDGFLVDANVYPGSSGSLVLLKPQGTTVGPNGETVVGGKKTPYVLGVVFGSIPYTDGVLGSTQRIGLGVAVSAKAVRELITEFTRSGQRFRMF